MSSSRGHHTGTQDDGQQGQRLGGDGEVRRVGGVDGVEGGGIGGEPRENEEYLARSRVPHLSLVKSGLLGSIPRSRAWRK